MTPRPRGSLIPPEQARALREPTGCACTATTRCGLHYPASPQTGQHTARRRDRTRGTT